MNRKIRPSGRARTTAPLVLALTLFALTAGCNQAPNTGNSSERANSNNAPANASPPANTPPTAETSPSTAKPAGLSPTEAVRAYYEAGIRKDIAGIKRLLSRASLQLMEDIAKSQGKTLDQLFSEAANMDARKPPPVFSDERIVGDTAFVDVRIPDEPRRTMPLVKEEGEWKLAFGKPKSSAIKR